MTELLTAWIARAHKALRVLNGYRVLKVYKDHKDPKVLQVLRDLQVHKVRL